MSLWGQMGAYFQKYTVVSESIPCSAAEVCLLGHAQLYKSCINLAFSLRLARDSQLSSCSIADTLLVLCQRLHT